MSAKARTSPTSRTSSAGSKPSVPVPPWNARTKRRRLTSRQMRNLRPLAARLAGDWRARQLGATGFHDERMLERIPRPFDVGDGCLLVRVAHVVADEMARDAELNVAVDELVVLHVK